MGRESHLIPRRIRRGSRRAFTHPINRRRAGLARDRDQPLEIVEDGNPEAAEDEPRPQQVDERGLREGEDRPGRRRRGDVARRALRPPGPLRRSGIHHLPQFEIHPHRHVKLPGGEVAARAGGPERDLLRDLAFEPVHVPALDGGADRPHEAIRAVGLGMDGRGVAHRPASAALAATRERRGVGRGAGRRERTGGVLLVVVLVGLLSLDLFGLLAAFGLGLLFGLVVPEVFRLLPGALERRRWRPCIASLRPGSCRGLRPPRPRRPGS
jgi:hypothetical protein